MGFRCRGCTSGWKSGCSGGGGGGSSDFALALVGSRSVLRLRLCLRRNERGEFQRIPIFIIVIAIIFIDSIAIIFLELDLDLFLIL